ncbi:unnamed protein product [Adineta ricciae]|uniref:Apple domain-containing protein n=1 Tax=Adineta ricciae TaxID=249248 RepID=A0A815IW81_ADIRI|nr:unnamed protein product [Adineta ricciae]CAF1602691.1 unnamed protein product [Adineta ricciae]
MLLLFLFIVHSIISRLALSSLPIRSAQIKIYHQHSYIVSHIINQIGFGVYAKDLYSCIYSCQNNDFCRTAVFDSQLFTCRLYEECNTQGQMVFDPYQTLISFLVCKDEPDNAGFSSPLIESIPMQTVMSNAVWIQNLTPTSDSWWPFFVNDEIYVPIDNVVYIYETNTYSFVRSLMIPVTSSLSYLRGDSQGILMYTQQDDPKFYIYSLITNQLTTIDISFTGDTFCYSTSFIAMISTSLNVVDVYLRTSINNSATFIYRINGWNSIDHCIIINDEQMITTVNTGGLQTTMLSKANYNSTITTLSLNTSYLPTGAALNIDAANRLYAAPDSFWQTSTAFSTDGKLLGTHGGTQDCAGKASKYKFILLTTDGSQVSVYEYKP